MKPPMKNPNVLALTLSMALLSSAALQSHRIPLRDEFEPFRLSISADSTPDFISSRTNPDEISRNRNPGLGHNVNDDDNINANRDELGREIAATVNIEISEVKIYSGTNLGTEPGNPPFTVANPGENAVMRTQKAISGLYPFKPPMDSVDVRVDGGPSDAEKVECFIITDVRGQYLKFGLGGWITAQKAVGVYCFASFAMEEVEGQEGHGGTGVE